MVRVGGPSFIDDTVEPEADARLEHSFKLAKVALEHHRTEAIVVGRPGKVEPESVSGSFEIEPVRLLKLRFQPGYYLTFGGEVPMATVYGFLLGALYPIKLWLMVWLDGPLRRREAGRSSLPDNHHAQPRLRVPGLHHAVARPRARRRGPAGGGSMV